MKQRMLAILAFAFAIRLTAATPDYSPDVETWHEVAAPIPQFPDREAYFAQLERHLQVFWHVELKENWIQALTKRPETSPDSAAPTFKLPSGALEFGIRAPTAYHKIEDGWLIAVNKGEFGGELYWFNSDGTRHVLIAKDVNVESFFERPDGIFAIHGLAHLNLSHGGIFRVRKNLLGRWVTTDVATLPGAPMAWTFSRKGTAYVVTNLGLALFDPAGRGETLLSDQPWRMQSPQSCVLSADEKRLYIGMHQFVAEIDLAARRVRFLSPIPDLGNYTAPNGRK